MAKGKKLRKNDLGLVNNDDYLDGLTIVVTGIFQKLTRNELENFIKAHGGKTGSTINGKTNYLIAGHKLLDGRKVEET